MDRKSLPSSKSYKETFVDATKFAELDNSFQNGDRARIFLSPLAIIILFLTISLLCVLTVFLYKLSKVNGGCRLF